MLAVEERYMFEPSAHRIEIKERLRKHTTDSAWFWRYLQSLKALFHGVVRNHSAVFSFPNFYVAVHHFIYEKPDERLLGTMSKLKWRNIVDESEAEGKLLSFLEERGFEIALPNQAWLDAYLTDVAHGFGLVDYNWHLESPKHKLMIWALSEDTSFLIEYFFGLSLPPYGVREAIAWPEIKVSPPPKNGQIDLFSLLGIADEKKASSVTGEAFEVAEKVEDEKLRYAEQAVEKIMRENDQVMVAYSGGKDSHTCLLLVINYLLKHPECKTKVSIVSASTLVENPLLEAHIEKVRDAVATLHLDIPFHIVTPDMENTYMVCVFGRGYQPPSVLNKWCVSRLKILPAEEKLKEILEQAFEDAQESNVCLVLGTRESESLARARSIEKHFGDDFYGSHRVPGIRTASPIRNWTAKDVATFLVRNPAPWEGYSNYELINLYGFAMGGEECPIGAMIASEAEAVSSCTGKAARMGCYSCTVIRNDESLENMAEWYEELNPCLEFRKILKLVQDIRYGSLTGYKRYRTEKFGSGLGDLTLDIRTLLLEHMNRLGLKMLEEEVDTTFRFVREREVVEGIPLTNRFVNALMKQYPVHPGVVGSMFDPIFDPWGTGVDKFTEEDKRAIERVLSRLKQNNEKGA